MMKDKLIKDLVSYPFIRRGNYQMKISIFKNMSVVIVAHHVLDLDKFFVKHIGNLEQAADFIEFTILKDEQDGRY
jgi:hypothetical protein